MRLAPTRGTRPGSARSASGTRTTPVRFGTVAGAGAVVLLLSSLTVPAAAVAAPVHLPVTVGSPAVMLPLAPDYPSAAEIDQAKESEAASAATVEDIERILAGAQDRLAASQVEALQAQSAYNEGLIVLQDRRESAEAAQAQADAAAARYTTTKTEVGELAADLYRTGGVTPGVTALLSGTGSSDDFLYRAATMQAFTANRSQTFAEAEVAAKAWAAQQSTASAAQDAADEAAVAAEAAKAEAQLAADAQSALVAETAAKRQVLLEQLATLQDTTVELQEERIAGIERQRQEETLAGVRAAAEERARQDQTSSTAPGGTGLQNEGIEELPSNPEQNRPPAAPGPSGPSGPDTSRPTVPRPEEPADPAPAPPAPAPPATEKPTRPAPPPSGFNTSVMVNYAMSKVGVGHYSWAGNGPMGFDCSGLIQQAFKAAGKNIARGGTEQFWNAPVRVPLSQARYGDILAFGSGPFYHVGIYLGNNKIVHALNPRQGIMVNDLSELIGMTPYYLAARY